MGDERFLSGKRILVVEDIVLIALDLEGTIEEFGGQALGPATTVQEALQLLEEERPDGVLLDINLAGEPAYPIAEQLARAGIPFIFMTGYDALPDDFTRYPFITKPFDYMQLRLTLRSVFAENQVSQQAV